MLQILNQLTQQRIISPTDYYFAQFIGDKQPADTPSAVKNLAILLAALCHHHYQQGNTCLFLNQSLYDNLFDLKYRENGVALIEQLQQGIDHLPIEQWQRALAHHPAFTDNPQQQVAPLVFQFNALYFYRTWQDEYSVANYVKSAVQNSAVFAQQLDVSKVTEVLHSFFPQQNDPLDWQKIAVATAIRQGFCVITGGPGTGKTTTVARLLLALQALHCHKLQIGLVAPTGKAAARLTESIANALQRLAQEPYIQQQTGLLQSIPTQAQTLHRLLGLNPVKNTLKFNSRNPLELDLLVVDEASMIDLSMMTQLLQALKPQTRLILLGDKDQLSSVEAGAILAELGQFKQDYSQPLTDYLQHCTGMILPHNNQGIALKNHLCHLTQSHRFGSHSAIGQLAMAINQGNVAQTLQCLRADNTELEWIELDEQTSQQAKNSVKTDRTLTPPIEQILSYIVEKQQTYLYSLKALQGDLVTPELVAKVFQQFTAMGVLTALRVGELGVENLNQRIAERLKKQQLVQFKQVDSWYVGKPIMVTQNDHNVNLFNGDIGLYFPDGKVWFQQGQHYRAVLPSRVPEHEPAFVMTVHKSQGSEFDQACLILPLEYSPLLSRELIYTAVTRAKRQFTLFSNQASWQTAVRNPTQRQSGLGQLLRALLPSQT